MVAKYYLSDPHLGHANVCKFRTQFNSVEEHDAYIKENYHKVIRKDDFVTFLGDVTFTIPALDDLKTWPGIKSIYLGNHDNPDFKKHGINLSLLQEVFGDRIYGFGREKEFWLSHCPIHPSELRGRINLHGHIHSAVIDDPRYFNLCMEHINYTPISIDQIRQEIAQRNIT